jgi:anti-sigma factor RsiW
MNHLGERLTALVDGELNGDERDRALAHLAGCEHCRAEADVLRRLKRRLRILGDTPPPAELMARLHLMSEPGDPLPPRIRALPGQARIPAAARSGAGTRPAGPPRPGARRYGPADNRPRRVHRMPRARYLAVGAATLAVFGVGTASFVAGAQPRSLPRVAPAVGEYSVEHAVTAGDVPLIAPGPSEGAGEHP